MAITLASLVNILPRAKGTAFGLASFSLAIGASLALLGPHSEDPLVFSVISLVSALALGVSLTLIKDLVVTDSIDSKCVTQVSNDRCHD